MSRGEYIQYYVSYLKIIQDRSIIISYDASGNFFVAPDADPHNFILAWRVLRYVDDEHQWAVAAWIRLENQQSTTTFGLVGFLNCGSSACLRAPKGTLVQVQKRHIHLIGIFTGGLWTKWCLGRILLNCIS